MKLKNKLKSFWRHNKRCMGIWGVMFLIPAIILPPYGLSTISFVALALLWCILWREENKNDTLRRIQNINRHTVDKMASQMLDFATHAIDQQRELTAKKALVWFEEHWQDYVDTEAEELCFKPELVLDFLAAMRKEERPSPQPSPVK